MKTAVCYRNVSTLWPAERESLIDKLAIRYLRRYLLHNPPDLARLRVALERSGHRGHYRTRLRLALPRAILACAYTSPDLSKVLDHVFVGLGRQLEHHRAQMRQDSWRRKGRRTGLRQLMAALDERREAEFTLFRDLVRPLLPALQRFTQRQLARLQACGDLAPGDPVADEVIDEALARACEQLPQRPRRLEPLQWLYQITIDFLAEEVARRQRDAGRFVSLESRVPIQSHEAEEGEDEIVFEYWQPDEVLRLEDLVPAPDETPEDAASAKEMRQLVNTLLADLPTPWRRAVALCRIEALSPAAAAQALGTREQDVVTWLAHADAFLKAKLVECMGARL
ncbi:RNA polymerase subunit sigma-28 [Burkholderia sp. Bp8963]|uniref:RNA polymerase sigma factor n=1 Tax=Burkholderia sp. Bp8963 TaxID=2184547 RepID=UPI000F5B4071|nr:RNA polymerase subunit sigma-28 [Burkholderia sp. Bp8963]RQS63557.1 RNA polymerase subunit sigma-28 [Burkholderia sp. Bp8963]